MTKLCGLISLHAGGGWEGHVFFQVQHPVTKKAYVSNSLVDIDSFCEKNDLYFDKDSILEIISEKLNYDVKYGWRVPSEKLNKNLIITSCSNYLKEIQKDLF